MCVHIAVSWKSLKRGSAIFCAHRHTQHTEWPLLPLRQFFDHLETSIFINSSRKNGGPFLERMPHDTWSEKKNMMMMMMMMICIQLYITAVWLLVGQASRNTLAAGSRSYFVSAWRWCRRWLMTDTWGKIKELLSLFCFYYFVLWSTNAQLFHKLLHSYMFRHYRVILRELVINTLPSYTSISNAAVGNAVYN